MPDWEPDDVRAVREADAVHSETAQRRREQILQAAIAIITEEGLQNLSLSKIEERAKMSRGQLTYYFPTKEDILLGVFDRLMVMMFEQARDSGSPLSDPNATPWMRVSHLLETILTKPPLHPAFPILQFTFLSQIGHREDFRLRLARLYESWRMGMSLDLSKMHGDFANEPGMACEMGHVLPPPDPASRVVASLVQGILHGVTMQLTADPNAFDRHAMLELVRTILAPYFNPVRDAHG